MLNKNKSLVLFSGGQDSTISLFWALSRFKEVYTLGFNYNQNHKVEMDCRLEILNKIKSDFSDFRKKLKDDYIIDLKEINNITNSSLTNNKKIKMENNLPNTFVPGRNLLFFNYAAIIAYQKKIKNIIGGMCETDFSGYPDCRDETLKYQEKTINLGTEQDFKIITPLMNINKAETWEMAFLDYGIDFLEMIIENTHTCYKGDRKNRQDWGYGCNNCPACNLRSKGWLTFINKYPKIKEKLYVHS